MVTGIVLVNVERPFFQKVIKQLMDFEEVSEVYTVAGEYDLVVMVRVADSNELSDVVVNRMSHEISNITHTKTLVAIEANSKVDLNKIYS